MDGTQRCSVGENNAGKDTDRPAIASAADAPTASFPELQLEKTASISDLNNLDRIRNAHEQRFLVVRDLLKSHTDTAEQLIDFCNDAHRWMVDVDHALRVAHILPTTVACPMSPPGRPKHLNDMGHPAYATRQQLMSAPYPAQRGRGGQVNDVAKPNSNRRNADRASNAIMNLIRQKNALSPTGPPVTSYSRQGEWDRDSENEHAGRQRRGGGAYNSRYSPGPMLPAAARGQNRAPNRRSRGAFTGNRANNAKQQKEGAIEKAPTPATSTPAPTNEVATSAGVSENQKPQEAAVATS